MLIFIVVIYSIVAMINYGILSLIIGIIVGYIIMYITSNIIRYHGYNSNDVRNEIYYHNGERYKLIPHVI